MTPAHSDDKQRVHTPCTMIGREVSSTILASVWDCEAVRVSLEEVRILESGEGNPGVTHRASVVALFHGRSGGEAGILFHRVGDPPFRSPDRSRQDVRRSLQG